MIREFAIKNRVISESSQPFVIAEIGHNHGGCVEHCKDLIIFAYECGCDAVKLQKRQNEELYTKTFYNKPYDNPNSFGATYGLHREALELDWKDYKALKKLAESLDLIFFATPFDQQSVDFLFKLGVPAFKIASGDLTNIPLIRYIADKKLPIILSTGGGSYQDVARAVFQLQSLGAKFALLHCVASYPNLAEELNLGVIGRLKELYPDTIIGFSSHYDGILAGICAYNHGAQIIEYHFTDSHVNKGTDHALSLQPSGMKELIHYLHEACEMRGDMKVPQPREKAGIKKMSKSLYPTRALSAGHKIIDDDLRIKSPGGGVYPYEQIKVVGKTLTADCSTAIPLTWDKFK